jgi:hypothetical protein
MTALDEARADNQSFSTGLTAVLMILTHNCSAMFRCVAVRRNVNDTRQLPRDGEQRSIIVQGWNNLGRETWAKISTRGRYRTDRGRQLDANSEFEVGGWQDVLGKD